MIDDEGLHLVGVVGGGGVGGGGSGGGGRGGVVVTEFSAASLNILILNSK